MRRVAAKNCLQIAGSGFTILSICSKLNDLTRKSYLILTSSEMRWGLGKHMTDLDMPRDQIQRHYFLELWIDMWLYTFSVGLSKFVILGLYWRLFSKSLIRQPIRMLFALSALWIVGRVRPFSNSSYACKTHERDRSSSSSYNAFRCTNSGTPQSPARAHSRP
jgi:hypothetical protein